MSRSDAQTAHEASAARRIETRARGVLADCLRAFHAFAELGELAENLRILSLNAELAAGRAGSAGRSVRALTQYTRELVNRLGTIRGEMNRLRGRTYALSATALRELHQLRLFERALEATNAGGNSEAAAAIRAVHDQALRRVGDSLRGLTGTVAHVEVRARVLSEIVTQSDSIATNIAIEAMGAGVHEPEFRTVATTMRGYVEDLRKMIDDATTTVRQAVQKGEVLQRTGLAAAGRA